MNAADKAWATRRLHALVRSQRALKAWRTRKGYSITRAELDAAIKLVGNAKTSRSDKLAFAKAIAAHLGVAVSTVVATLAQQGR